MDDATRGQLNTWFHEHADRLLVYLLRRCDRAVAEDVLQETFLIAARRVSDVPAEVYPWLCGTARRVLSNHQRSTRRRDLLAAHVERQTRLAEDLGIDEVELRLALAAALRHLSTADQELLMLVALDDFSAEQVAIATGTRPGTVAVRLHRARNRLARHLNADPALAGDAARRLLETLR